MLKANGETLALVLGCIDYRTQRPLDRFLRSIELRHAYDATQLPGASLAGTFVWGRFSKPENRKHFSSEIGDRWIKTVQDVIQIAIDLHHIKKFIVVDHLDCGAYNLT